MQFTLFYIHFTSACFCSSTFGSSFNFKIEYNYEKIYRSRIVLLRFCTGRF